MYSRKVHSEINSLAKEFRIVTVIGPRQAGKITLCRMAFPDYRYISLEDPDTHLLAAEDPRAFLKQYRQKAIIDGVQRVPALLSYIQTIVDEDNIKCDYQGRLTV